MEGRNLGIIRGENPKKGLTSAKELPIELPESLFESKHYLYIYIYLIK